MTTPVNESTSETCSFDNNTSIGLTPEEEKQLQEDTQGILDAETIQDPEKQEVAMTVANMKYWMDYTIFTTSPPLSPAQVAVLKDDYNKTIQDSHITGSNIYLTMQLDSTKFGMDLFVFTHTLSQTQIDTLAKDYAQLESDYQITDKDEKLIRMLIGFARYNLDITLFTYPQLSSWEITQLETAFSQLSNDRYITDHNDKMAAIIVDTTRLEKDTLTYCYPLTSDELSKLNAIYEKMVKDSKVSDHTMMSRLQIDQSIFQKLKTTIIQNHAPSTFHIT